MSLATEAPLLELQEVNLVLRARSGLFGRPRPLAALQGVSLAVRSGEAFGLVGESGCGKSSLAKTIVNLHQPTSGRIRFAGIDLRDLAASAWPSIRRRLQYVFQDPLASLDPRMTILDQVVEVLHIHNIGNRKERRERGFAQLRVVGLGDDLAQKHPHALSGGQRQRAVLARALVLQPELLICDEPLSALDVSIQAQVVNLLADLREELGLTLFFISHDLALVRHLCSRVAVMYMGRVVEEGPSDLLFDRARHPYTQALVAASPIPEPRDIGDEPRWVAMGEAPSLLDPPAGCSFHPRCPFAFDRCRTEQPILKAVSGGQSYACHLDSAPIGG